STSELLDALLDVQKAIYCNNNNSGSCTGCDRRKDIYEVAGDSNIMRSADGVVSLFYQGQLYSDTSGNTKLTTYMYGPAKNLCQQAPCKEAFYNQVYGAYCSGFLVAKDLIVTAG